jgi:hypothetical protein
MRTNQYRGRCACGEKVAAWAGYLLGRSVVCAACAAPHLANEAASGDAASAPTVRFESPHSYSACEAGMVPVRLVTRVEPARFAVFRGQVTRNGGHWNPSACVNVVPSGRVASCAADLRVAEFNVEGLSVAEQMACDAQYERQTNGRALDVAAADVRLTALDIRLAAQGKTLFDFQREGVRWLAPRTAALLADDMGLGKAQPLDAKVLTPTGWRCMGDLVVGDEVIGSNGHPCAVVGVYPRGERDVYRVTFSDGASTECCDEHLWQVNSPVRRHRGAVPRVLALADIRASLTDGAGNRQHFIPMVAPVQFHDRGGRLLDPYLMGYLLGNGTFTQQRVGVCAPDAETVTSLRVRLPAGAELRQSASDGVDYRVAGPQEPTGTWAGRNPVLNAFREYGLMGHASPTKFVPEAYLWAPVSDRVELLRGLCDADGSVSNGVVEFCSTSPALIAAVVFLVESLGGNARVSPPRVTQYTYDGEVRDGVPSQRVIVAMPDDFNPFRLTRKAAQWKPREKYKPMRAFASVDYVGKRETRCIAVDATDHLYVTERFIVTHNTIQALCALPEKARVVVIAPGAARGVWLREIAAWRPDLRVLPLEGRGVFLWPSESEVIVTSYDCLPADDAPLPPCPQGTVVVFDEAHAIKNAGAKRTKRAQSLCAQTFVAEGRVWLLTATPLMNKPDELWTVLQAGGLAVEAFGSFTAYKRMFNCEMGKYAPEWGKPTGEVIERLRSVSLRRRKEDVLRDLPDLMYREVPVPLGRAALAECERALDELARLGLDFDDLFQEAHGTRHGVKELGALSKARHALAVAKTPAMLEMVADFEEAGEPVVVFSAHRDPIDILAKRDGWAIITGDQSPAERTDIEERFQRGELRGIGATIQAGGVALTLTRACNAIFVDEVWTPAMNRQAQDRIRRIGQTRPVTITKLVGEHYIDRRVTEVLARKAMMIEVTVDAAAVPIANPTAPVATTVVEGDTCGVPLTTEPFMLAMEGIGFHQWRECANEVLIGGRVLRRAPRKVVGG